MIEFEPTNAQKAQFRKAVMMGVGRTPLDPKIQVSIDRYAYTAEIMSDVAPDHPSDQGDDVVITTWSLDTKGVVRKKIDTFDEGEYLAGRIKENSLAPKESKFDQEVRMLQEAFGISKEDATNRVMERIIEDTSSKLTACSALVKYIRESDRESRKNGKDPFGFQDAIQKIRDNFVAI